MPSPSEHTHTCLLELKQHLPSPQLREIKMAVTCSTTAARRDQGSQFKRQGRQCGQIERRRASRNFRAEAGRALWWQTAREQGALAYHSSVEVGVAGGRQGVKVLQGYKTATEGRLQGQVAGSGQEGALCFRHGHVWGWHAWPAAAADACHRRGSSAGPCRERRGRVRASPPASQTRWMFAGSTPAPAMTRVAAAW